MDLTVAYQLNKSHLMIKHFSNSIEKEGSIVDLETTEELDSKIDFLIQKDQDLDISILKNSPVIGNGNVLNVDENQFQNISYESLLEIYKKSLTQRTLESNLSTIENSIALTSNLYQEMATNRDTFILNLKSIIEQNLEAHQVRILFKSVDNEDSKKLITKITDETNSSDSIRIASQEEEKLFTDLENEFGSPLHITHYNKESGELTLTSTINTTKIIIMAHTFHFGILHNSILMGLFRGLHELTQNKEK